MTQSLNKPMQFKDKFASLAKAAEVTQDEQGVAEFFWYAGLQHAFQRGTSEPSLLRGTAPVKAVVRNTPIPSSVKEQYALTPHEAKLLVLMLRDEISQLEEIHATLDVAVSRAMQACEPNGSRYQDDLFRLMNSGRNKLRQATSKVKKLSEIQRKLKKLSKGS